MFMSKFFKSMIICISLCTIFLVGCSKNTSSKPVDTIRLLNIESIRSAKIELKNAGGFPHKSYTFDLNNPKHIKIIKDIISDLNSSTFKGYEDVKIINKGSSPTFLILTLKDNSVIQIEPALKEKITKLSDGSTEVSQSKIPDEIAITTKFTNKPIEVLAPNIRKLIDAGYKDVFE